MSENSKNLEELETAVEGLLAKEKELTPEIIRERIRQFRAIFMVSDDDAEMLARQFEARHGVTMTIGSMLKEKGYEPWLDAARADIAPYYWERYKKLLIQKRFSAPVVATLDSVTDRILGLMENPEKPGPWNRRGMVVGHVQSGKTANYTGLICKAADAGYRLIVVIAGIHNNLRNQTQLRIDEGFVGRDSAKLLSRKEDSFVGVGDFDKTRRPVTFTNSLKDFSKAMATGVGIPLQTLNEPAVFVIKKNSSTLKNLLEWLAEHNAKRGGRKLEAPMLLIDDEADNASINTAYGKGEVTRINGQIRSLLDMFERGCYVGYTATPFANIFIDPDSYDEMCGHDLFPRNFIVSLDPPTNYFGASRVFLQDSEQIVRHISDNEDVLPLTHKKDLQIITLPNSLMNAVRTFVVAKAIRLVRGHARQHCSMLVNTSRFTEVQRQLRNELHSRLDSIKASVRVNGALSPENALKDAEIKALHDIWDREYSHIEGLDWSAIQHKLHEAAARIQVVEVNSRAAGTLNYADHPNGLNVIAVGGYSLSRGLTLEGLMVSYFLRNSMMYDTLMQMGRWFGYRPEYDDLCRVWMPEEAEGWYAHVAEAIEELREELRKMEVAGATPEEFGLKVRSHPTALIVTARNKMGSGEKVAVKIGLGNNFVETAILKRDMASLETNRAAARQLAERLTKAGRPPAGSVQVSGGWLLQDAPVKPVLDFLAEFQNHPGSMLTEPGPVRRYIEERADTELAGWDILFAGIKGDEHSLKDDSLGITIHCQRRTAGDKSDTATLRVTNKQRVSSRGVEKTGLTKDEIETAEQRYRATEVLDAVKPINYPDRIYRAVRKRPLLIIHLLEIKPESGKVKPEAKPVVAWSISFPVTVFEEKRVEYVVNTTWWRENFPADDDEEEMSGGSAE